jgi:hypothetical protein
LSELTTVGASEVEIEIAEALDAFTVEGPLVFSLAGGPSISVTAIEGPISLAPTNLAESSVATLDERLARAIQSELYNRCYAHRLGESLPDYEDAGDPAFGKRIAEANTGREHWDPGWVIYQFGTNGQVFVRKGERERVAIPGSYISDATPNMAPQLGGSIRIRVQCGSDTVQPGYYFAFGETLDELADQLDLVRCYFHCAAQHATRLLSSLTSSLNKFQVPFQAKAPTSAAAYGRTDALVLYISARYFAIAAQIINLVCETVPLAPSVPLFAKRLLPGVGAAVEPGTGESFGLHRCRLAAEGIVDAWRSGRQDIPARLEAVRARFTAAGLDLSRPYLGPGGTDVFMIPAPRCTS